MFPERNHSTILYVKYGKVFATNIAHTHTHTHIYSVYLLSLVFRLWESTFGKLDNIVNYECNILKYSRPRIVY